MANVLTQNNILDLIEGLQVRHPSLNSFFVGKEWDFTQDVQQQYPAVQCYFENPYMPEGTNYATGTYPVIIHPLRINIINQQNDDNSNLRFIKSDCVQYIQDVITEVSTHPFYIRSNSQLTGDIELTELEEYTQNNLAGYSALIRFKLMNSPSFCGLPQTEIEGYDFPGAATTGFSYSRIYLTCAGLRNCSVLTDIITGITSGLTTFIQPNQIAFGSSSSGITSSSDYTITMLGGDSYASLGGVLVGTTGSARFIQGLAFNQLRILSRNSNTEINLDAGTFTNTYTAPTQIFQTGPDRFWSAMRLDQNGLKITSAPDMANPCTVKFEVGGDSLFDGNININTGAVTINNLSGTIGRFVQVDALGKLIATATTAGSSASLQPTFVGLGSGTSGLTGTSDFTYTGEDFENAPYYPSTTKLGTGTTVFTSYDGAVPKFAIVEDRPFMIASTIQNTSTDPSSALQFILFNNDQSNYFSIKKYPIYTLRSDFGNYEMSGLTVLHNTDDGYTPNRPIMVAGAPIYNSTGYQGEMNSRLDAIGFKLDAADNLSSTNTYPFQVTNMFYNGSYLNVGNGSNSVRVGASGGTSYINGVGTNFNVIAGANLTMNAGGTGNQVLVQSNGVFQINLQNQQLFVIDTGGNVRINEGGLLTTFSTDKVNVVRQSNNAVRVTLENKTGGTNSSAEYLLGEANGNGSLGRYNSLVINNFSGTSINRKNVLFLANTITTGVTTEAIAPIVFRGTPVITLIGTGATNYGHRSDSTGTTFNTLSQLHLTSTARVDIASASTAIAQLRLRSGSTVSSPNDGDIWYDGSHLYGKLGGAVTQIDGSGTGSQGTIATWSNTSGTTQLANNTGYFNTAYSGNVLYTLPLTANTADVIELECNGFSKWVVNQNAGQYVKVANGLTTSLGTAGSMTANTAFDSIRMRCISADTVWVVTRFSQQPQIT